MLLGPPDEQGDGLPDVLCVIQVALEGGLSKDIVQSQLKLGNRSSGDLVPWMVSQQYQVDDFGKLDSARIVRIATHPDVVRMGYGRRAMELLKAFYQGELWTLKEGTENEEVAFEAGHAQDESSESLRTEKIKPRKKPRPLLFPLSDMKPQLLHYVSVSFGVTEQLFEFWNKAGFRPFYVRQTPNELTGEHSCIMICPLSCTQLENAPEQGWEDRYVDVIPAKHNVLEFIGFAREHFSAKLLALNLQLCIRFPRASIRVFRGLCSERCAMSQIPREHLFNLVLFFPLVWYCALTEPLLCSFCADFARRFITLLSGVFRSMGTTLALTVIQSALAASADRKVLDSAEMKLYFLEHDMKRLEAYARNLVGMLFKSNAKQKTGDALFFPFPDYHLVADLVPQLARLFFQNRFAETVSLSMLQKALLVGIGLQGNAATKPATQYMYEQALPV